MFLFRKKEKVTALTQPTLAPFTTISDLEKHIKTQQKYVSKEARRLSSNLGKSAFSDLTVVGTMNALVSPFLKALDWNVENPSEVKVATAPTSLDTSYTLYRKGKPAVLIDVVRMDNQPNTKFGDLADKLSQSEAKIGILTNGIEYYFHTHGKDGSLSNIPFASFRIDTLDIYKSDKFLTYLFRYAFSADHLLSFAEAAETSDTLTAMLNGCTDDDIDEVRKVFFDKKYCSRKRPSVEDLLDFVTK